MVKRKIIADNCYMMIGGQMQKLAIGTVIEATETAFGKKAVTVASDEGKTLEVATPEPDDDRETAIELYEEKYGKKPHGRMTTENIMAAVEADGE